MISFFLFLIFLIDILTSEKLAETEIKR
ncbi:hypothetical protein SUSAZ_09820 [Sulfolobus acidocaldarius SUSAZ]|nr:hypothetical protein SUSAZ_09820 [Sulfolobus acidocaldarius SUSAZ]